MMDTSLYLYAFKFFTTWVLVMCLLHHIVFDKVNLLLLSWITCIVGLYLSFINPRKFVFYFEGKRYEYTGLEKFFIVDSMFHILVLYFIITHYGAYYSSLNLFSKQNVIAISILLIYLYVTNIKKVYGISVIEVASVSIVAGILYVMIFGVEI